MSEPKEHEQVFEQIESFRAPDEAPSRLEALAAQSRTRWASRRTAIGRTEASQPTYPQLIGYAGRAGHESQRGKSP